MKPALLNLLAELAKRQHARKQDVNRIVNLGHATKIDTIAEGLESMERNLELRVQKSKEPEQA